MLHAECNDSRENDQYLSEDVYFLEDRHIIDGATFVYPEIYIHRLRPEMTKQIRILIVLTLMKIIYQMQRYNNNTRIDNNK